MHKHTDRQTDNIIMPIANSGFGKNPDYRLFASQNIVVSQDGRLTNTAGSANYRSHYAKNNNASSK